MLYLIIRDEASRELFWVEAWRPEQKRRSLSTVPTHWLSRPADV